MTESPGRPTVAVIPARGGSKRIPRKNIRPFLGMPLLARTIMVLIESRLFDRIVVSTDDNEVARIAQGAGAETPFLRPRELADDHTPTVPVVAHALRELAVHSPLADVACCVYPTAVLMDVALLRRGRQLLEGSDARFVVPVAPLPTPIERALRVEADGKCRMAQPEHRTTRTQDLEPAFHDAGQFYWGATEAWLDEQPIYADATRAVLVPAWRVQDIDTEEDWVVAEHRFQVISAMDG